MIPNLQLKNLLNLQNNSYKQPNLITEDLIKDNFTDNQKTNIENFILTISICVGAILIVFSYLNMKNREKLKSINDGVTISLSSISTLAGDNYSYQNKINALNKIKSLSQNSTKYSGFFNEVTKLFELLKNQTLILFEYSKPSKESFAFKLVVNSTREDLFNESKKIIDSNTKIKNFTMNGKVKVENSKEYQYTFTGEYDGR